ncbi:MULTISPECIES: hypothetical protein [Pyrobaculum]|uniref:Polymerase beta nucleotidyltransferase domain-containing protein n=2 Tax=Pyrobaculum arsenaticum TaxID=121277 RepID=A4WJW3_PYRAR|nr:hypothetical protein [Pyrobaculum arsenaticum]ABP50680.1 conserved hypothetical protein [Pyrobaculum arsenaticum DSM 13514]MCY0891144.1 hypothetical protein [Pyrobaculum arsenaticum]NYR14387.1 hypothetical protein [Pyrobaculum arsenaticum]
MSLDRLVKALGQIKWGELGACLVVLHGSALRRANPRDVDLFIFVKGDEEEAALRAMEAVEAAAGIEADVYVASDVGNVNCFLLLEALRSGVILYKGSEGVDMLVKAVGICNDFMISRRKVKYTETLVERALGRVAGEAP